LRNLHLTVDLCTVIKSKIKISQKICGLLRIYELYEVSFQMLVSRENLVLIWPFPRIKDQEIIIFT